MRRNPFAEPPLDFSVGSSPSRATGSERLGRIATLLVLPGLILALIASAAWQLSMGVASMGGDEADLTRGWKGFWLSLPGYALGVGVTTAAFAFAWRARRAGAANWRSALVVSTLGRLLARTISGSDCCSPSARRRETAPRS